MPEKKKKLFLLDGNALVYRAYYAIKDLRTSGGVPTNAVYGFINMLRKIIREYEPDMMAVAFDLAAPTSRHEKYEEYKENRSPTPDDLIEQMPKVKEVIRAYNIPVFELEGFEADDLLATLSEKAAEEGLVVTIVTSDKDALQLVRDGLKVLSPHPSGDKIYGPSEVLEKYGVLPGAMVELMAFTGDVSDNIPGVRGIGKVTAAKLIDQFGSVDKVYENIDEISSASLRKKLLDGREMAELSRELVVLDRSVPVEADMKKMVMGDADEEQLKKLFSEFEFTNLLKELSAFEAPRGRYDHEPSDADLSALHDNAVSRGHIAAAFTGPSDGHPLSVALCAEEAEAFHIKLTGKGLKFFKGLIGDPGLEIVLYDIKKVLEVLEPMDISIGRDRFDVMLADYLCDPARNSYSLGAITLRRLGIDLSAVPGRGGADEKGQGILDLSGEKAAGDCCLKADMVLRLYDILSEELDVKHLKELFLEVEVPLAEVLSEMERIGVGVDIDYLRERSEYLAERLEGLTSDIYDKAGEEFNINSPKQLQVILYDKLGLPAFKKTKTGVSTDESVLRKLADHHELPKLLIEYRELKKLKSAYYDSIVDLVDESTGILHARFNQAVTATGRLSSSEPNLQNIPIRTELGKEIRRAFRPVSPDKVLLAADYSQIELRILAHLSGDKGLIRAFRNNEDVHVHTASLIFGVPAGKVTKKMRSVAKTVNFGIIYGISPFGLAKDLGIRVDEAQKFIRSYFERYGAVEDFVERTIESARADGYVTTILKRRRYIPEISGTSERARGFAERVAVNTPVQGSAADLIKLAMIECHREFKSTDINMLIQVHDELVFEVPEGDLDTTVVRVRQIMENVMELDVPLLVDIESGPNWYDMDPVG